MTNLIDRQWLRPLAFLLVLAFAGLAYLPGLDAPFRFDDFSSLDGLQYFSQAPSLEAARFFLESGGAGPLGRPLSLATFLAQAGAWPNNPAAFHTVNLLLHLVCGLLVFALGHRLAVAIPSSRERALLVAGIAASAWLLQPMFVSTVLYAVQRMAQLATLFCLLGALGWLAGRNAFEHGDRTSGTGLALGAGGTCLLLGVFSKENAAVLPLLLVAMEIALPQPGAAWRRLRSIVFGTCLLAAIALAVLYWQPFVAAGYAIRDFTLAERLLTQGRILWQYLGLLLLPLPDALGLVQDVRHSTGWLSPLTTLAAWIGWSAAVAAAWFLRRRVPGLALAVFWFLGAHTIESSVVPAELYFEHRNYLPAAGLYIGLGILVAPLLARGSARLVTGAWLALLALVLVGQSLLWGSPIRHAELITRQNPDSIRAHMFKAQLVQAKAGPTLAARYLRDVREQFPAEIQPASSLLAMSCLFDIGEPPPRHELIATYRNGDFTYLPLEHLDRMIAARSRDNCSAVDTDFLLALTRALQDNPVFTARSKSERYLGILEARLLEQRGDISQAATKLDELAQRQPSLDLLLYAARLQVAAGAPDRARGLLDHAAALATSHAQRERVAALRDQLESPHN